MVSQSLNRSRRQSLERVIGRIFEMDKGIRMVAVYQGQYMLAGGMRKGVDSYDPNDAYEIDMQLSKMGEIARSWEQWFGELSALVLKYDKINLTFQPLNGGRFLVMSTEPQVDSISIMTEIARGGDFKLLAEAIP